MSTDSPELFDSQAAAFDLRAGLPEAVCREIARNLLEVAAVAPGELVVEIGAGTGQIGQWISAPSRYVGFDLSCGMLNEFARRFNASDGERVLIQADANATWPLADGAARAIFGSRVLHLLDPEHVAAEAQRVASPAGATLIAGRVERHPDSVRARMAREMNERLQRRGIEARRGEQGNRRLVEACCKRGAQPLSPITVATWQASSTPRQSLASWRSLEKLGGHRVTLALRDEVLGELEAWATETFGGLDEPVHSAETYVLGALRLPPRDER